MRVEMRKPRLVRWVSFLSIACSIAYSFIRLPQAASAPLDYAEASRFLEAPLQLNREGTISFQKNQWKLERDGDGTELLSATKIKAEAAVMKNTDGKTEAVINYVLNPRGKSTAEKSSALFFENGKLTAVTLCDEVAKARDLGRVCVTATSSLCADLRSGKAIDTENLNRTERYETRALAAILTLRGSDHQLDNMLATGNRLGLKSALQTTRGQLRALAQQVEKESGASTRNGSSQKPTKEELTARHVLEYSLPRLKASCNNSRF